MLFCGLDEVRAEAISDALDDGCGGCTPGVLVAGELSPGGWLRGRLAAVLDAVSAGVAVDWARHAVGSGGHCTVLLVLTLVAAIMVSMLVADRHPAAQVSLLVCESNGNAGSV